MISRFSNSYASVLRLITMHDNTTPTLTALTELNDATHRIKELDGATDVLAESEAAIQTLQTWKDQRFANNRALSEETLDQKKGELLSAASKFTLAKYLMISCSAVNILTMFYLFSQNENHEYANNGFLNELCKTPGRALSIVGALEGSIHLYKAKRGYVQMQQLALAELQVVDQAIEEKQTLKKGM
jgi:hypothetical protein